MKLQLIKTSDQANSTEILKNFYKDDLIVNEKKPFIINYKNCTGPYLASDNAYLLDACSQIATLGLGFNSTSMFGTAHILEGWTGQDRNKEVKGLKNNFINLLKRQLNWKELYLNICHSGSEANEKALYQCYINRVNKESNHILAFEGSFHGRSLISLSSTWSAQKREPFEMPEYKSIFCPYPFILKDNMILDAPNNWQEFWRDTSDRKIEDSWQEDEILKLECDCLLKVKECLLLKKIFAIIIEPMQCEGGDRYSSNRFHQALLNMALAFKIPVIYDEIQTGFNLSTSFFWHQQFKLKETPDYIVCAKKAQVGLVLSKNPIKEEEEFSITSFIRGKIQAASLLQSKDIIKKIQKHVKKCLQKTKELYPDIINNPRSLGLCFAFDLIDSQAVTKFINLRLSYGIMLYPAGEKTLRFRLNTAFLKQDIDFLFMQIHKMLDLLFKKDQKQSSSFIERPIKDVYKTYKLHENLILLKLDPKTYYNRTYSFAEKLIRDKYRLKLIEITKNNFKKYKKEIYNQQIKIYEKSRQTPIEKFEKLVFEEDGIIIAFLNHKEELIACSSGSTLINHKNEGGVLEDTHLNNKMALYIVDNTIDNNYQNKGIGFLLKYIITITAISKGFKVICGRNRDQLAAGMLKINLSLGADITNYIDNAYNDSNSYKTAIYYNIPLDFKEKMDLSSKTYAPIDKTMLDESFISKNLPLIVNKICLSNFVSRDYLSNIKDLSYELKNELRHIYCSSGQSEAVDKILKTIWYNSDKKKSKLISFKGHYFSKGTFLSQALSSNSTPFNVDILEHPNKDNYQQVLIDLENLVKKDRYLAIFIEPLPQNFLCPVDINFLQSLKQLCSKENIKLIYNETASCRYNYNQQQFFASSIESISPDGGICYLGGQAAISFVKEELFIKKPLMLISTWDGDEYSLNRFMADFKAIKRDKSYYFKIIDKFQNFLKEILKDYNYFIHNGCGVIKSSNLPQQLEGSIQLNKNGDYLIYPSFAAMKSFLKTHNKL